MNTIPDVTAGFARADDGPNRFRRHDLAADALTAGQARTEFKLWLQLYFTLSTARRGDLLLAMNEALANAAEHAYFGTADGGTVDVDACYDVACHILTLTVVDHGRWLGPALDTQPDLSLNRLRGRGIQLMRALADNTLIDSSPDGTHVTLTWDELYPLGA